MSMRLHKWIATQGVASRRVAERWILAGRVEVNGTTEKTLGRTIDPAKDRVRVDGQLLGIEAPNKVYWMLYKPDATITSRSDPEGRRTVFDLPAIAALPFTLASVGRLDYRTEGVLLLSNDGELVHRLMHPKFQIPRTYDVLLPRKFTARESERFAHGFVLADGPVGKVGIRPRGSKNMGASRGSWYRLTVHEGRNRLVRRLFEKVGVPIVRLVRVSYGPVRLSEGFKPGEIRQLSSHQIQALKRIVGLSGADPTKSTHPRQPG